MTNEPEPNTRAGEALKPCQHCDCLTIEFIPSTTGRSADRAMCSNCGMQGPVRSWQNRTQPYGKVHTNGSRSGGQPGDEPVFTPEEEADLVAQINGNWYLQPNPQPSELVERLEAATKEINHLQSELDITNADHIALWIEANTIPDEPMSQCASWLACRIVEAHEAQLAKLQADGGKLADAARHLVNGLNSRIDAAKTAGSRIPVYVGIVDVLDALTEWKDRA